MLGIDSNNRFISPQRIKIIKIIEQSMSECNENMEIYQELKNLKDLI